MKTIKDTLPYVVGTILLISFIYGSWRLNQWLNYKFKYQSQVQEEIQPLVDKIDNLEKRVSRLEKR